MKPKRLPFEEFTSIYSKVPRLCVDLMVQKDSGILLIKREIQPSLGKWHFPGGTVLLGETLEDSIQRIAKEELNIEVEIEKLLGYMEFFKDRPGSFGNEAYGQTVSLGFLVKYKSGEVKGGFQGKEIRTFDKIPENMVEEHEAFLKEKLGFKGP